MKKVVPLEGFGGGGTPLDFKIVAYATEEELLADTPMENTIGVITDVPITGYRFSAAEPEVLVEGMVWIKTGVTSSVEFNIVKNDEIIICPLDAHQYINSTWVFIFPMSYLNNSWNNWIVYLYRNGSEFNTLTGGWEINQTCGGTITKNSNSVSFDVYGVSSKNTYGIINTVEMIDLTEFSKLTINSDWTSSTDNGYTRLRFGVSNIHPVSFDTVASPTAYISSENILDISTLTGEYYVFVGAGFSGSPNYKATLNISEIILE